MENEYHSIRKQYQRGLLLEDQLDRNPFKQLDLWLSDAMISECPEPTAMVLSTTGHDLKPSSRVVLMKGITPDGITFFTNYESRKGKQLLENPQASLLFFWPGLERQVRIEGNVKQVSKEESDTYFNSRPEASRISAAISPQSREISDRNRLTDLREQFPGHGLLKGNSARKLTRPANWGGYRLTPDYFEFWQGREDRLHDRLIYQKVETGWRVARLAP